MKVHLNSTDSIELKDNAVIRADEAASEIQKALDILIPDLCVSQTATESVHILACLLIETFHWLYAEKGTHSSPTEILADWYSKSSNKQYDA